MDEQKAKAIMGINMVGSAQLRAMNILQLMIEEVPEIQFTEEQLEKKKNDYYLILGIDKFSNGRTVTIRSLIETFGKDPEVSEPCFYNQDWYDKEEFIDVPMNKGWFLIRKNVYEETRAVQPVDLLKKYVFPSAVLCTYAFFTVWLSCGVMLWYHDFVWCSDLDHNGDRIYVGKYNDIDSVNKNGYSIHRHLALRPCYGCID